MRTTFALVWSAATTAAKITARHWNQPNNIGKVDGRRLEFLLWIDLGRGF